MLYNIIMTVSCWNKIVRIITSSLTTFILINDFMYFLFHIGFHNVVLSYYKFHDIVNTKLSTLK